MPCEFKLKGYCFHPERANREVLAANCAYSWLNTVIQETKATRIIDPKSEV